MLKAAGEAAGLPLLVLGLTGENMARLMADEPIMVNAADLGLPGMMVVLVGGKTEQAIRDDVQRHLGDKLRAASTDRMPAYRAARAWAREHGHQAPDDRMIDAALTATSSARVELPPEPAQWDGVHTTSIPEKPSSPTAHAICTCGWPGGPIRSGPDRRWQAMADADEHYNSHEPDRRWQAPRV